MRAATLFVLALACACSGGGGDEFFIDPVQSAAPINEGETPPTRLTAQDLLQNCITTDLNDFSDLLDTLLGLFSGSGDAPTPQLDLLAGLLSGGVIPWTLDLDGDNVPDISGDLFFRDAGGKVTIPFDVSDLILGGLPENPADLLADIPDGVTFHLTWSFTSLLLQSGNGASGDGELAVGFAGGQPDNVSATSSLTSGGCTLEFEFEDVGLGDFSPGTLPEADAAFTLEVGENTVAGTAKFDGTDIAVFTASVDGGPDEVIRFDIRAGRVVSD